ncbi:MAG: hypothetical protein NZ742_04210, partial [Acidobacteria bacterium]|nr:hypothetical protein [Acidobacteriota bacterium]MDW7984119.1 hypothetical protein [Acidobacteriota bacterium]
MQSGGRPHRSKSELRVSNSAQALSFWVWARIGRWVKDRGLWAAVLLISSLIFSISCKQVKEVAIPDPDSHATALYVLKILNIQPDNIDINTEGTASATIFARLTDARGNPLANQGLFFEVLDVPNVPFV